jgi:hypothetical protein
MDCKALSGRFPGKVFFSGSLEYTPAALQVSRAGRKRAPTVKALEAEKVPKRGTEQGRGRGRGKGTKG